jgi:hypothetical protein
MTLATGNSDVLARAASDRLNETGIASADAAPRRLKAIESEANEFDRENTAELRGIGLLRSPERKSLEYWGIKNAAAAVAQITQRIIVTSGVATPAMSIPSICIGTGAGSLSLTGIRTSERSIPYRPPPTDGAELLLGETKQNAQFIPLSPPVTYVRIPLLDLIVLIDVTSFI